MRLRDGQCLTGRWGGGWGTVAALAFVYGVLVRLADKLPAGRAPPATQIDAWRRACVVVEVLQTYDRRIGGAVPTAAAASEVCARRPCATW
jgi:hypothetical protein